MVSIKKKRLSEDLIRIIVFLVVFAVFIIANPVVIGWANLVSLLNNMVYNGILALGLMLVILTGNLDLSICAYSVVGGYATIQIFMKYFPDGSLYLMLLVAAFFGALCGVVNALLICKLKLPGILVTVATSNIFYMMFFLRGTGSGSIPATQVPQDMLTLNTTNLFTASSGGITVQLNITVLFLAFFVIAIWWFLNKTTMGRNVYALGGNPDAAMRMGINILQTYIIVFAITGALAGFAGMMSYAKQMTVTPLALKNTHGNALAAVIFGGTQLGNGKGGSVLGTMVGVATITLIQTSLVMIGIPSYAQTLVIGILILGGVLMAAFKNYNKN